MPQTGSTPQTGSLPDTDAAPPAEPGDAFHAGSDAAFGAETEPGETGPAETGPATTDRPADGNGPADPNDQPGA